MNLKDILLELISSLKVKVKLENEIIDVPVEQYYKLINCEVVECCKCVVNGKNELTLYLNADTYKNITTIKNVFNLEPLVGYLIDY